MKMKLLLLFVLLFSIQLISADDEDLIPSSFNSSAVECPVVKTLSGSIGGCVRYSYLTKRLYCSYLNIPYAEPPVGPLRFQAPVPYGKWTGVRACDERQIMCAQASFLGQFSGVEDCLIINVHVPTGCGKCVTPVLASIHSGGFLYGSGEDNGPQKLMDHCIIMVTFNYRLGILGSLNTQDNNSHGNYNMLDQVLALKWIQNNIAAFGGDPKQVTLTGDSAGSVSVIYHLLSPLSKGLFVRAFAQSGSPLSYWGFEKEPVQFAYALAAQINCSTKNNTELVGCFKNKSAQDLIVGTYNISTLIFPIRVSPSIDKSGPGFLRDDPLLLLQQNQIVNRVPLIYTTTGCEGVTFYDTLNTIITVRGREYFRTQFKSHISLYTDIKNASDACVDAIFNHYCSGSCDVEQQDQFKSVLTSILSDVLMLVGGSRLVDYLSDDGIPLCVEKFSYLAKVCYVEPFGLPCTGTCAAHADDLFAYYVFLNTTSSDPNDILMSSILVSNLFDFSSQKCSDCLFCNRYDSKNPSYVNITLGDFSIQYEKLTSNSNVKFWTKDVYDVCKH